MTLVEAARIGGLTRRIAYADPTTLACMHGGAWSGNGAMILRPLADRLA